MMRWYVFYSSSCLTFTVVCLSKAAKAAKLCDHNVRICTFLIHDKYFQSNQRNQKGAKILQLFFKKKNGNNEKPKSP